MIKNKRQKVRFGLVGIINTVIDFSLLFGLTLIGLPTITANILSSSTAFILSFLLNKKVTFKTSGTDLKREIGLFIVVTLFGLWVIQNLVILAVEWGLRTSGLSPYIILAIAKVLATGVSLIWNYVMYSRFVFKSSDSV